MLTKGKFHEDLIKALICSLSQENFRRRGDWEIFQHHLKTELVAWHPIWLYNSEVLMYGINKDRILFIGFCVMEGYSPTRLAH